MSETETKTQHRSKEIIIEKFNTHVRNKKFIKSGGKKHHDGAEGHWLEKQMGIAPNSDNAPDLLGYEQKKYSKKITFGDWSASSYYYKNKNISRDDFIKAFGSPNPKKNNRYSWSGSVFPKYGEKYNFAGQRIRFLDNDNLVIEYSYKNDTREEKDGFLEILLPLPPTEPIILAIWEKKKLETHLLNKFGVKGFYICKKDKKTGLYNKICFGKKLILNYLKKALSREL